MKKYFSFIVAVATMFAVTSCSQEEVVGNENNDANYVSASFTVNTPEGMSSRAIGDGTTVNKVVCATFDAEGVEMEQLRKVLPLEDKQAQYSIRLVKGQNYRVAFFAFYDENGDNVPEYYNIDDLKNIKINDALSNIEGRDAFTAKYDIETGATMQPISETITLYRPFAQLNLGTYYDDWTAAVKAGVEVSKTKIIVSNVYKTFSAFDDAVVGETSEMTFNLNTLPTEPLKADIDNNNQDEDYVYLALNYLLVGDVKNEKNLTDITFVWETEDGKTNNPVTEYSNIPVQRNYRTNIIGWLLTNPAEFNIVIDEEFEKPDYNIVSIDGTVSVEDVAKVVPNDGYIDQPENVATIADKHITAEGTAIELDELPANAEGGVLYIKNTTVNANTFLEINGRFTIIIRNCHLNVNTLLKNNTEYRDLQIIFQDCYVNGTPLTDANKENYIDVDDFGTVLVYFGKKDEGGNDNQGGTENEGTGNEGEGGDDNQGGAEVPATVKFSDIKNTLRKDNDGAYVIENATYDELIIDEAGIGVGLWNVEVKSLNVKEATNSVFYFKNVKFINQVSGLDSGKNIFIDNCYLGNELISKANFKSAFGFEKTGLQYIMPFNFSF